MIVIVMGVTGSGKSTTAALLAERIGLPFHDADAFHSPENRAKMARDIPLTDDDRRPWLEHLGALAAVWAVSGGAVLACSALKQAHRDVLVQGVAEHRVVYLELPRAEAERRLRLRRGHHEFVGEFAHILDGQYRDLEPPIDGLHVSYELTPEQIVERAAAWIQGSAA